MAFWEPKPDIQPQNEKLAMQGETGNDQLDKKCKRNTTKLRSHCNLKSATIAINDMVIQNTCMSDFKKKIVHSTY